jgi:hypothetical protein
MSKIIVGVCVVAMGLAATPVEAQERESEQASTQSRDDGRLCCDAGGEEPLWRSIKDMIEEAGQEIVDEVFVKLCEIKYEEGCNGGLM